MKQVISILSILVSIYVFAGTLHAGTTSLDLNSPMNISHAMDVAVRSNSLNYLYTQEPLANDTSYVKANESKPGKLKSPTTALVIALVSGAVVHGAGHFYAGKTKTAIGLFGAEAIGAGMTLLGMIGNAFEGMEGSESKGGADAALIIGLGLFAGSWIYDVAGSPFEVKNQNDKILGKKPFPYDLDMKLEKGDQQIKCLLVKRF